MTGFTANTRYVVKVVSRDSLSNRQAASKDTSFTTLSNRKCVMHVVVYAATFLPFPSTATVSVVEVENHKENEVSTEKYC